MSTAVMVIDAIVVVSYIAFGTFGNVLIIAAAILRPKLRTPPNLFIVNVAVTDFVMASFGMTTILLHVVRGQNQQGDEETGSVAPAMCITTGMTIVVSCGVSLLSLCLIAFNRYMSVCQFQYYPAVFARRNLAGMIGGTWIFSLGIVLVSYFTGLCAYRYDPDQVTCTYNNAMAPCTYLFIVVGVVIPSILASVFYLLIYRKLHETSLRLHSHAPGTKNGAAKKSRKSRKEVRSIVMMFTAFALFVIVWFPYGIVMVADAYIPQSPWLIKVVTWLAFSNCGINWIVYGAMNRNFRSGYRDVIMGCRKQAPSTGSGGTDDSTPKPGAEAGQSDATLADQTRPVGGTPNGRENKGSLFRQSNGDYRKWDDV